LEKVSLFQGLEPNDLFQIEPWCSEKEYKRDEKIFFGGKRLGGGDPANYLYILIEGAVGLRFDLPLRETDKVMKVDSVKPGQNKQPSKVAREVVLMGAESLGC